MSNANADGNAIIKKVSQVTDWKFKTKGAVVASPVVSYGSVYIGSEDGLFYSLNASSGKLNWQYKTPNRITTTAAVHKKFILFESGNTLYALNKQGSLNWKFELASKDSSDQLDPWDFHHSSPVIYKGNVYIGSADGAIYGVSLKTGQSFLCKPPHRQSLAHQSTIDPLDLHATISSFLFLHQGNTIDYCDQQNKRNSYK